MASAPDPVQGLEKILTCAICLDILKSPKTLPCTHSYCEQCLFQNVKSVKQNGEDGILCPQCRAFFKKGEYLKLYVLRELLEFHTLLTTPDNKKCQLCEEEDEAEAEWTCVDCKMNLCEGCQKKHRKTPNCRAHTYRPYDTQRTLDRNCYCQVHPEHVTDLFCVKCNKCKVTDHDSHKSETLASAIERLTPVMGNRVESVDKHINHLEYENRCLCAEIPVVKGKFDGVRSEYTKLTDFLIAMIQKNLKEIMKGLDERESETLDKIKAACKKNEAQKAVKQNIADLCKTTLSTAKGCTLLKGLTEGLMEKITEEERKPVVYSEVKLKAPVFEKNPDVGDGYSFLKAPSYVEHTKLFTPWNSRAMNVSCSEMMSQLGECIETVELQGYPYRLAVVESDIWIPCRESNYKVYNTTTKTLTQHNCETLQRVNSFCETHTGDVMAACNNGLYTLNTQGEVLYKVSNGLFSDVCTDGERLLAVEYKTCKVHVYKLTSNKWSKHTEFSVKGTEGYIKTLHVDSKSIYIDGDVSSKIYIYSLEGDYTEEYGSRGGDALGKFFYPLVCGIDSEQALVVCDELNDRIQERSRLGEWKQYTLEGVKWISDVIKRGGNLYVLHGYPHKMSVYSIKAQ